MNKNEKKFIYVSLIIIILFSSILLYKIETTPKYDQEVYEQIYKEYEQIASISSDTKKETDITYTQSNSTATSSEVLGNVNSNSYSTIAIIDIPKINITYPVVNECTDSNLEIAPTKLVGPTANTVGNFVIVAHNNWNQEFFSNLHKLEKNDIVNLTDVSGKQLTYKVYEKSEIAQDDFSCLNQNTNDKIELTLITCVKYHKSKRLIVKCVAT